MPYNENHLFVISRRHLAEDEYEFPDPDDGQEELFIAEDGKSTR